MTTNATTNWVIGGGAGAMATTLFRLGSKVGKLTETVENLEDRIRRLEAWRDQRWQR